MIFDTHCHAYWKDLDQRENEVRANMLTAGVTRSVQIGADRESNQLALDLANRWADTWCTVGIHPTDCQDLAPEAATEVARELEQLFYQHRDKVVGIGETGLDYYHLTRGQEVRQKEIQHIFFAAQAQLARQLDLPLVIHTRNAPDDTIRLIEENTVRRAVIHCFSEDPAFAATLLDWSEDIYFSFSGVLTYKNAPTVRDTARMLPLERILVETDSPFLAPQAVRGQTSINEPAFTRHVMDFLKTLRGESPELVEQTVWENSHRFFKIPG